MKPDKTVRKETGILLLGTLILCGVVFVTSPAGLLERLTPDWMNGTFWTVVILLYYLAATLLPIDKVIGRFYPVFGALNRIPYRTVPLAPDFRIRPEDYCGLNSTIVLANPNAPTGLSLTLDQVEDILARSRDHVVILDEAYVDFGGESALALLPRYENLLVVQTFSKSRSMAGARLGFALGSPELIGDLKTIQYSTNPYNVNRMTAAAGIAALREQAYYDGCCRQIMESRAWTKAALEELGFSVLPSSANFLFARSDRIGGETLYLALKKRGILSRHFTAERINDYNRITIGTREQMEAFLDGVRDCLEDQA